MMTNREQRKVSAVAQLDASWNQSGDITMDVPTVSLYGDAASIIMMDARDQIMVWMKLMEEIEEKIAALEDESGLDRDDVVNVAWWRLETIDTDDFENIDS